MTGPRDPHVAIMQAAKLGRGLTLTAAEVWALAQDDAIESRATYVQDQHEKNACIQGTEPSSGAALVVEDHQTPAAPELAPKQVWMSTTKPGNLRKIHRAQDSFYWWTDQQGRPGMGWRSRFYRWIKANNAKCVAGPLP